MTIAGASYCDCSRDIRTVRLNKNISLEEVSSQTDIPVDALKTYEARPYDIPLSHAVKILTVIGIDFKNVCFKRLH
jgi:Uncharacterized protein conserved in bacteria